MQLWVRLSLPRLFWMCQGFQDYSENLYYSHSTYYRPIFDVVDRIVPALEIQNLERDTQLQPPELHCMDFSNTFAFIHTAKDSVNIAGLFHLICVFCGTFAVDLICCSTLCSKKANLIQIYCTVWSFKIVLLHSSSS